MIDEESAVGLAAIGERRSRPRRKAAPGSRLVPAKQAAEEWGVPVTTLRDLVFCGDLPVVKFGRSWRFRRDDLDALIERHTERIS